VLAGDDHDGWRNPGPGRLPDIFFMPGMDGPKDMRVIRKQPATKPDAVSDLFKPLKPTTFQITDRFVCTGLLNVISGPNRNALPNP
jgi:hypothetical protein